MATTRRASTLRTVAAQPASSSASNQASLTAAAERYVELQQDRAASVSTGNLASLQAEQDAYVAAQQDRAASVSTGNLASLQAEQDAYVAAQQDRAASVSTGNLASLQAEADAYVAAQQDRAAAPEAISIAFGTCWQPKPRWRHLTGVRARQPAHADPLTEQLPSGC